MNLKPFTIVQVYTTYWMTIMRVGNNDFFLICYNFWVRYNKTNRICAALLKYEVGYVGSSYIWTPEVRNNYTEVIRQKYNDVE
jgi:hypothetical protein